MRSIEVCKKCIQFGNMKEYWCGLDRCEAENMVSWSSHSHSCAKEREDCEWCSKSHDEKLKMWIESDLMNEEMLEKLRRQKAERLYEKPPEECPYKMEHFVMVQLETVGNKYEKTEDYQNEKTRIESYCGT